MAITTLIAAACGTDQGAGSGSTSNPTWPPSEIAITGEQAIEIALENCTGSGPSISEFENPSNPVAALMTYAEFDRFSGDSTNADYVDNWHWVVEFTGSAIISPPGANPEQLAAAPSFRYKSCVLSADSGDIRAGRASPAVPLLTPFELRRYKTDGSFVPNHGTTVFASGSPKISRDEIIEIIRQQNLKQHYLNRIEIELVEYTAPEPDNTPSATPTPGIEPPEKATARAERATARARITPTVRPVGRLAWLVTIPEVIKLQGCSGPAQEKTIGCMNGTTQSLIDAETGEQLDGAHSGLGLWFFTSEQWSAANNIANNYRKESFTPERWEEYKLKAAEQGHWELWRRLKEHDPANLPEDIFSDLLTEEN